MFERGLVAEAKQLLCKYGESARPLSSIGYREVVQMLRGEVSKESAVAAVQQAHRNYAKRQMTWFRKEIDVNWIEGFGDELEIQKQGLEILRRACS